ncbi:MAG: hypothetical protein HWD61_02280 [Parachlamydiaceae bacterium]|nr:MAG: hypothetical protein HWD61_02280 [Parachlamydiaceae bacterium]
MPIPNTLTFSNLKDCKYDLVSCQSGSENHAYTFVKSNGKWIKFDDASVGIVSDETALVEMGQGCDILIFRRSDPS